MRQPARKGAEIKDDRNASFAKRGCTTGSNEAAGSLSPSERRGTGSNRASEESGDSKQIRTRVAYFPVDPFNPYQQLFYRDLHDAGIDVVPRGRFKLSWLVRHRSDAIVLHLHWPQAFYRVRRPPRSVMRHFSIIKFVYFIVRLGAARALGYRLVWTIHQVYPHDIANPRLDRLVPLILSRTCHALLAHDDYTASQAQEKLHLPPGTIHVIPLPSYVGAYPEPPTREAARAALGVSESSTMFLCFGGLRRYKNTDIVLDAFELLPAPDATLMIAGLPVDKQLEKRIHLAAARDQRIKFMLELVPDQRVPTLFAAADVAILPRGDGGTSAALVLALAMGVPVVAAETPNTRATTSGVTAAWLFRPGDAVSLRACLESAALNPETRQEKTAGAARIGFTLGLSEDDRIRAACAIRGDASPMCKRQVGLSRRAYRG